MYIYYNIYMPIAAREISEANLQCTVLFICLGMGKHVQSIRIMGYSVHVQAETDAFPHFMKILN